MRTARPVLLLVSLLTALASLVPSCSKKSDDSSGSAGLAPSASAPITAASLGKTPEAVAPNGPCKVDVAPFVIDKGARAETGVTLVRLPDDRFAIGYATAEGAPHVAILLPEGSASVV